MVGTPASLERPISSADCAFTSTSLPDFDLRDVVTCVVTAYLSPNWPIDAGESARLFNSKQSINGCILGPRRPQNDHSACCRAVLSLIGSQFDVRTTTVNVALFPAIDIFRKLWVHKGIRLEQSHDPTQWTDIERRHARDRLGSHDLDRKSHEPVNRGPLQTLLQSHRRGLMERAIIVCSSQTAYQHSIGSAPARWSAAPILVNTWDSRFDRARWLDSYLHSAVGLCCNVFLETRCPHQMLRF